MPRRRGVSSGASTASSRSFARAGARRRSARRASLGCPTAARTRPRDPDILAGMTFLASLDGAIAPVEQTQIPVTDEGLLRGDGGFEVTRIYGGRPFALDDHYARLERTCAGIRLQVDHAALRREVDALVERAGEV